MSTPVHSVPVPETILRHRAEKIAAIRAEAAGVRQIAAFLDTPGIPQSMAEKAADSATLLEGLARDMERFWKTKGAPVVYTNTPPEAA